MQPYYNLPRSFTTQPYYNLPQAPGQFQEAALKGGDMPGVNIYDVVEKERSATYGYVCGVALVPLAYLVCFYLLVEGLVVLLHERFELGLAASMEKSEEGYLYIVAWGDIVTAIIGAMGIWFSHNLLPIGWRSTSKMHGTVAIAGAGALLLWRSLVCVSFAPWAGIMLAFSPPSADKVWMWTLVCVYLAFSIFLVYVLLMAFRQAVSDGRRFQRHLDAQALEERKQLLVSAGTWRQDNIHADGEAMHDHEVEPELFGVLPLAETVTLYTVVIAIACVWAFIHLLITGHTSGGWAFFASTPHVSSTFWLEVFLYPLSFVCALIGLAGASSLSGSNFLAEKSSTSSVLFFLLGSIIRFALLFAVTGMDLLENDTCGFYLHGVANLAYKSPFSASSGFWLHCSPTDWLFLAVVWLCCALDAYLIWGTFQLWHHAQEWEFVKPDKKLGYYGAAQDDGQAVY
jgi:hypothetical protein